MGEPSSRAEREGVKIGWTLNKLGNSRYQKGILLTRTKLSEHKGKSFSVTFSVPFSDKDYEFPVKVWWNWLCHEDVCAKKKEEGHILVL